jgi:Zn-dependent oligopeptidase
MTKCIDTNVTIMEKLVSLRHTKAKLLGYRSHAHYVLEIRLAKTPEAVTPFLKKLSQQLEPLAAQERDYLLQLKRQELLAQGKGVVGLELHPWDTRYYQNQAKTKKYKVDHERLKQYFPLKVFAACTMLFSHVFCMHSHLWLLQKFAGCDKRPARHLSKPVRPPIQPAQYRGRQLEMCVARGRHTV